jgi:tRNA(Arg) A34 adenosine deaminase TadA
MTDEDARLLRQTFDIARRAETKGNMPFGALLAGSGWLFPRRAAFC